MPDRIRTQVGGVNRRDQEVAPGEFAQEVYVRDAWSAAIGLGRAYIIGTGRISLSVAGNLRALIRNPSTDTVVTVLGLSGLSTATGWPEIIEEPTTGLPAGTPRPHLRMNPLAGVPAITEVTADTDATVALGGGTATGVVLGTPSGNRIDIRPLGLVLGPGMSRGINVPFAGAADVALAAYITEEPA